jgi:hypothetical protein
LTESLATTAASAVPAGRSASRSPAVEILRDIARGGFAGILVGIIVAGLGGRLVMRLATILHENTVGLATENGELIGRISLNGTMALITFGGLGMGLLAGTIWVIVSPWIPGRGVRRAGVTALAAIALGTPALVQRFNPDFFILDHDPVVVMMLVALVGLVGFTIALVDGALDRRLPHPARWFTISTVLYVVVAGLGLLVLAPVVSILMSQSDYDAPIRAGWAIAATGVCTLAWWLLRVRGRPAPPRALRLVASLSLVVAVILGVVTSLPNVLGAAGLT